MEVYGKTCQPALEVTSIGSAKEHLEKAVIASVFTNSSKTENVRGMKDLILHRYDNAFRTTLVIENQVSLLVLNAYLRAKALNSDDIISDYIKTENERTRTIENACRLTFQPLAFLKKERKKMNKRIIERKQEKKRKIV